VEPGAPAVAEGVRSGSDLGAAEVTPPVLVGEGVEIGAGARIEGPAIVGDGCRIGAGAHLRDAILLEGAELPERGILVGGIVARFAEDG
jgi:NDP-sugar pyrophosphorylase family protein